MLNVSNSVNGIYLYFLCKFNNTVKPPANSNGSKKMVQPNELFNI